MSYPTRASRLEGRATGVGVSSVTDDRFLRTATRMICPGTYPTRTGQWQVSSAGGSLAVWSPRSDAIYYRDLHWRLITLPFPAVAGQSPGSRVRERGDGNGAGCT